MSQNYYGQPPYPGPYAPGPAPRDPGLSQPWYGIGFWPAVKRVFMKYADFSGRASRGEYWWFVLFNAIIGAAVSLLLTLGGINWAYFDVPPYYNYVPMFTGWGTFLYALDLLYGLAVLIPSLAVAVRRLHDTNKSGAWWCVIFIPFAGPIWFLVLLAAETYPGMTLWGAPTGYVPAPVQGYPGYPPQSYPPGYPPQGPPYPQGYQYPPQGYPLGTPPPEGWR